MHSKKLQVSVWVGLLVLFLSSAAWSQNPLVPKTGKKRADAKNAENVSLPKHLSAEEIDHIVAGLGEEQVRRLLLNELKAQAQQVATAAVKPGGVAGFIEKIKNLTTLLHTRIEYLRSGGRATSPTATVWLRTRMSMEASRRRARAPAATAASLRLGHGEGSHLGTPRLGAKPIHRPAQGRSDCRDPPKPP